MNKLVASKLASRSHKHPHLSVVILLKSFISIPKSESLSSILVTALRQRGAHYTELFKAVNTNSERFRN